MKTKKINSLISKKSGFFRQEQAFQLKSLNNSRDGLVNNEQYVHSYEFKLISLVLIILMLLSFAACNSPSEDVKKAEDNVEKANSELVQAEQDFALDMENYRNETKTRIARNDSSIREFKARIRNDKREAKSDYEKEIAELENKNTDMKKRIEDYKAATNEEWQSFKSSFKKEMDDLDEAVKRIFDDKD
jgi:TolA-binding protein